MIILEKQISRDELQSLYNLFDGEMIKAVVDIEKNQIAIDAELHSDLETLMLDSGSEQKNLWGINLWPEEPGENLVEFDSLINIRPWQGNRSRSVNDSETQKKIIEVVTQWIK